MRYMLDRRTWRVEVKLHFIIDCSNIRLKKNSFNECLLNAPLIILLLDKLIYMKLNCQAVDVIYLNIDVYRLLLNKRCYLFQIGRECSFTEDPIFNRFIKGKSISTEKQAEDLRQELSNEGETFGNVELYNY